MPFLGRLLQSLLVAVALLSAFDAVRPLEHGGAGIVIGLVALAALAIVVFTVSDARLLRVPGSAPHRQRDVSAVVAQSDPDAEGHSRPRAPGFAASAA